MKARPNVAQFYLPFSPFTRAPSYRKSYHRTSAEQGICVRKITEVAPRRGNFGRSLT
jgi:hypothetical protein